MNVLHQFMSPNMTVMARSSVIVWSGISMQGKTDLHIIENGTLTAVYYCKEIFDVYDRPHACAIDTELHPQGR